MYQGVSFSMFVLPIPLPIVRQVLGANKAVTSPSFACEQCGVLVSLNEGDAEKIQQMGSTTVKSYAYLSLSLPRPISRCRD